MPIKKKEEMVKIVDEAYELDREIKAGEEDLKVAKGQIRQYAKQRKIDRVEGSDGRFAKVSPRGYTECHPRDLYAYMKEIGREEDFWGMIKVDITKAKKDLGETGFGSVSTTGSIPYNTVALKSD